MMASSCASSSSSGSSPSASFFSRSSRSTVPSEAQSGIGRLPQQATLPALDAEQKRSTIRLPLQLPSPPAPFPEVDLHSLIVDKELEDAPLGLAIGKMRELGPSLLVSTTSTCLHIPPGPEIPPYLLATVPSSPAPAPSVFLPSHVLAIRSNDSPRTLLLPVHGLLWAAMSPPLSILSSKPDKQPSHPSLPHVPPPAAFTDSARSYLPVVQVSLPSSAAFPLLQAYAYLRSPALLLSSLLPQPPASPAKPAPPPSLSHLLNPSTSATPSPSAHQQTPQDLIRSLSSLPVTTLLRHIHLVHGLWQDVVALQIGDAELWRAMALAWKLLVTALGGRGRSASRAESPAGEVTA
ncbi:Clampless protein 1 [Rhodotorula toruloides]|nr:Clampless protein 1 [Rhodotorula toruloides]